jgi:hypothetical protein
MSGRAAQRILADLAQVGDGPVIATARPFAMCSDVG